MAPPRLSIYTGAYSHSYSPDALAKRPQLAEWVGRIVAEWAEVELQLAQVMCEALEASAAPFAVAFEALGSSAAQVNVATKTILSRLEGEAAEVFKALMRMFRDAKKKRDAVAHSTWGWSDQLPDALLAIDPKLRVRSAAAVMPHWQKTPHGRTATCVDAGIPDEAILVYRQGDLEAIATEARTIGLLLTRMGDYFWSTDKEATLGYIQQNPTVRAYLDEAKTRRNRKGGKDSRQPA